jgi:hypothetical protein
MVNLVGLIRPPAPIKFKAGDELRSVQSAVFGQRRAPNRHFRKDVPGLSPAYPAVAQRSTSQPAVCCDQILKSLQRRAGRLDEKRLASNDQRDLINDSRDLLVQSALRIGKGTRQRILGHDAAADLVRNENRWTG